MKNIIVTGASKGIGKATVLSLLDKGCNVIAVARSESLLLELVNESKNNRIIPVVADITTDHGRQQILRQSERLNGIDGLVNNAALLVNKSFKELSMDDWKNQFEVNFFAVVYLIQLLYSKFNEDAHIVNIGSMAAYPGAKKFKGLSAYGTGKAALSTLTEYLSIELSEKKISVNCLALGAVSTDMLKAAFPAFNSDISADMMGTYIADFTTNSGKLFNGKVIPVALNNPS